MRDTLLLCHFFSVFPTHFSHNASKFARVGKWCKFLGPSRGVAFLVGMMTELVPFCSGSICFCGLRARRDEARWRDDTELRRRDDLWYVNSTHTMSQHSLSSSIFGQQQLLGSHIRYADSWAVWMPRSRECSQDIRDSTGRLHCYALVYRILHCIPAN